MSHAFDLGPMLDGNTAALNAYEREQRQPDLQAEWEERVASEHRDALDRQVADVRGWAPLVDEYLIDNDAARDALLEALWLAYHAKRDEDIAKVMRGVADALIEADTCVEVTARCAMPLIFPDTNE